MLATAETIEARLEELRNEWATQALVFEKMYGDDAPEARLIRHHIGQLATICKTDEERTPF